MTIEAMSSFHHTGTSGSLYLVPTPIGNLADMTLRAIDILKEVDLIAAEDTRNTQKLLNHFEIKTPQISFHEHNTKERIPLLVKKLLEGRSIAQVSDAGMPSISDPGHELVEECIAQNVAVVPLPGANAGVTALIASGLAPQPFIFYGFLARKNSLREAELKKLNKHTETMIFYEAPHRLKKTLQAIIKSFGEDRKVVLCRELTKRYEEFLRGSLADALEWTETQEVRGEFCLIVEGRKDFKDEPEEQSEKLSLEEQVNQLLEDETIRVNEAIKLVAKRNKLKKQLVYNAYHHLNFK
ncbi:tetrapyrrole (Corrin Porphyrin) methylase family protein [Liquorilactobacillus aquaticus DSM 21051]|uniref:Ribosomal RNA small subunit methyltransferase I n=1 Tax=Liquorilactobacillus aquaticus DSM 21051 TaxID=1423725 RepID=A0A0R2CVV9_9LACO|nr:16S rRNA (cytidine(1402)-2'-O)-methyltransferase [Liquorilactobacillus aquaticus]KRM95896.1 tetrapyrrole (Corrin Porphyrin) methylase family protein [Liquorilactobacillus aquaticus DSM 21051]